MTLFLRVITTLPKQTKSEHMPEDKESTGPGQGKPIKGPDYTLSHLAQLT